MAQRFTDFSEYATGNQPSDWTELWNNTSTPWSVQEVGGSTGGKVLRFSLSSGTTTRRALTWDDIGSVNGDVELVTRFQRTAAGVQTGAHLLRLHASGSSGSESAYFGAHTFTTDSYLLYEYNTGAATAHGEATLALDLDTWYWMRLQRTSTTIRVRVWADGVSEPGSWDFSTADSSLSSGRVGVGMFGNDQTVYFDVVGVGTGGDLAPMAANEIPATPVITAAPIVSYGALTRLGPNNGATVTFTATDVNPVDQGADALSWGIYTATAGGGTEVASGTCTSGVSEQVALAYDDPGISEGSNTLYLLVSDGSGTDEASFALSRDAVAPVSFTPTPDPNPTTERNYSVEITASDATSTAADELTYQVRTAADGGGSLLAGGTTTSSGTAFTVGPFSDNSLDNGENTRYVRIIDGAGNVREVSYTITGQDLPERETALPVSRYRSTPAERISVHLYPPLGVYPRTLLDYDDINPSVTAIHWRSAMPGGWTDAGIGIAHPVNRYGEETFNPYLKRELRWKPFAHVVIKHGPHVAFEGRLSAIERPGGVVLGFTAHGYGLAGIRDSYYRNTSATTVTSGTLLRSMIANSAPHLRAGSGDDWQDPAVAHAYDEANLMELGDWMEQVALEGDTVGNLVDWWVYEGQRVHLKTRMPPTTPDYHVGWDVVGPWNENFAGMVGMVTYERMASGTPTTSATDDVDPDFANEHGFQRGEVLKLGEVTEAAALALRKAYLHRYNRPAVSASLVFGPDDALTGPTGRVMPKWACRAGRWIQVGRESMQMIVTTDYDATADLLRLEIGEFVPSFETLVAAFQKDRLQRQRKINSFGGRER